MTTWSTISDAETAFKKGIGQDLVRKFRDNDLSHEERLLDVEAGQHIHSITDDFLSGKDTGGAQSWIDAAIYDSSGENFNLMETDGTHVWQISTVATAGTHYLSPVKTRCRLRLNQDMTILMEFRVKEPGGTVMSNLMFGLQERSTVTPATEANVIAFFKGSTAGKWRFRVAKGGVQTEQDNVGNRATWQTLGILIQRSGGGATFQATGFIDGAAIGSPITTNLPDTSVLKPFMGAVSPGAGTTDMRTDRWRIRWRSLGLVS